jgi:hypothetical protein
MSASHSNSFHKYALILFLGLLFPAAAPAQTQTTKECATLSRSLKLGMSGDDVRLLQQLLNQNDATRIAVSGPGSLGSETMYFGEKTKGAVIRFQQLYSQDVLLPVGLSSGSGYVGVWTRTKLLSLCIGSASVVGHTLATTSPALPPSTSLATTSNDGVLSATISSLTSFKSDVPVLMFPVMYMASRGATVHVPALGLASSGNIVHLDTYTVSSTTVEKSGGLSFVIPEDAPRGKHALWISSSKGETDKTFFVITDPTIPPPVIDSVTPKEGLLGTKVTVTGSGFLAQGNNVRISYGVIPNVPSPDGKTLQFTVSPDILGLAAGEDRPEYDLRVPYWFSVLNDNGLSGPSVFTLKI